MLRRLGVEVKERTDSIALNLVCTEVGLRLVEKSERAEGDGEESLDTSVEEYGRRQETVAAAPPGDEHKYSMQSKQGSIMSWMAGQPRESTSCYGSEIPSV